MGEAKRRGTYEQRKEQAMAQQQVKIKIDNVNELPLVQCTECGCTEFVEATRKRRVSEVHPQNPTGQQLFVQQPIAVCMNPECRAVLPDNP